jgi:hydrogenase expression/formation protein HypC
MCLAVPGKILDVSEANGGVQARVQFGGITRQVALDFLPEAQVGDYVMVHVGFAISLVDADEAEKTYSLLREMGYLEEEGLGEGPASTDDDQGGGGREEPSTRTGGA